MKPVHHGWLASTPRDRAFVLVESVGRSENLPQAKRFRRDGWRSWQFQYTIEGDGFGDVDGQAFEAHPGSVTILPKTSNHGYQCDPRCPRWTYLWIEFDGEAVEDLLAMLGLERRWAVHGCDEVRDLVERVHACVLTRGERGRHEAMARFLRALAAVEDHLARPGASEEPLVEGARRWFERHLDASIRLEDCARALKVSPWHLAHVFKAATGMGPMAFLRGLRVARAKSLLQRGDLSVAGVGRAVGYPLAPHFTRMFRAETGLSPLAFAHSVSGREE